MLGKKIDCGDVLLAEPYMLDPNFKRSAVLLCDHGDDGSVGFIMNKPLKMRVDELVEGFPSFESEVFFGGPVQTDTVHYIHNVGDLLEESTLVSDGVYWGGNFEKLKFLITSSLIKPANIRFFVGYSGWSEGQLDDEFESGSWIRAHMHPNYIFKAKPRGLWRQVMYNKGDAYTVIAQMPESDNLN